MKMTALAVLLLALVPVALAQQSQVPYIETFEVRLHNLDVVVTDAKGQPVRGLQKSDFVVSENGVQQPVTNFSAYDTSAVRTSSTESEAESFEPVQPPPRHFVFFMDEVEIQRMQRTRLFKRVQEFVNAMGPNDVASVVRPTTEKKVVLDFTSDRAAIEAAVKDAIEDSRMRASGLSGDLAQLRTALVHGDGNKSLIAIAQREYALSSRRRVEHRLGQLRALTSSLGSIEGRKILIMVTMGLGVRPGSEGRSLQQEMNLPTEKGFDEEEDPNPDAERLSRPDVITRNQQYVIEDIGRSAAANGVTIYSIEPDVHLELLVRGNAGVPGKGQPRSGGGHFGPSSAHDLQSAIHVDLLQNTANTLQSLSDRTGGRWFRGTAGIDDSFKQVLTDLSAYYSLAYRANGEDGAPRKVKVQVRNRPDLKVLTRSEVLKKTTAREMEDLVTASLIYPRPVNELAIGLTAGEPFKSRTSLGLYTVPLDIVILLERLTFLPSNDGSKYVASFDVHFASAGRDRDFIQGGKTQQTIELTPAQFKNIHGSTYRYKTGINVSPGSSKIAIGVLDVTTRLTGFGTVEVNTK